jgi:hypothetical protein
MEGIKILVLDRGFVKVGRVSSHPTLAFHWLLSPARTIRNWGTSNGLGELVKGPTDNTVLDLPTTSTIPFRAVIEIIDVDEREWKTYL